MKGGGGFKFKVGGGLVTLRAENYEAAVSASSQKTLDRGSLFSVAIVCAALIARCEAHLHLGVDAAGVARIWVEIVGAAAQEKQLESFVGKALGCRTRLKRAVGPAGFALAGTVRHRDAWVRVAAQKADESRRAEVHAVKGLRAVDPLKEFELEKERLEFGAGGLPGDAAYSAS
jgi:hypothetical protein